MTTRNFDTIWNEMSDEHAEAFPPALFPRGSSGPLRREGLEAASLAGRIGVRGGMTYLQSRYLLNSVGVESRFLTAAAVALTAVDILPDVVNLSQQVARMFRNIPQHSLRQGTTGEEKYSIIRNEEIHRSSPCTFRHSDERYTITGIACLPVSEEIQSPEAEVVEGGINCSNVAISLKPEEKGPYCCHIIIAGKERQPHRPQRSSEHVFPPTGVNAAAVSHNWQMWLVGCFILYLLLELLKCVVMLKS